MGQVRKTSPLKSCLGQFSIQLGNDSFDSNAGFTSDCLIAHSSFCGEIAQSSCHWPFPFEAGYALLEKERRQRKRGTAREPKSTLDCDAILLQFRIDGAIIRLTAKLYSQILREFSR